MKKITKAELKEALSRAAVQHSKRLSIRGPGDAQRALLQKSSLESAKIFSGILQNAGLDLKKLQAAQAKRSVLQQRLIEQRKEAALRYASRQKANPRAGVLGPAKAWEALSSPSDIFPFPTFTLSTPFLIWPTPFFLLSDSAAVPFGSWAKFQYASSQSSGIERVSFYFLWESPFTDYAVINASTYVSASGYLKAHAPWTFWGNTSTVGASLGLSVWIGFPDGGDPAARSDYFVGQVGAFGQATTGGDDEGGGASGAAGLSTLTVPIPPRSAVFFEVSLDLTYDIDDSGGKIEADFGTGDFGVSCPVVVYSVLNSPPLAKA